MIADIGTWEVLNRSTGGSDHYPLISGTGMKAHQEREMITPRLDLDKGD